MDVAWAARSRPNLALQRLRRQALGVSASLLSVLLVVLVSAHAVHLPGALSLSAGFASSAAGFQPHSASPAHGHSGLALQPLTDSDPRPLLSRPDSPSDLAHTHRSAGSDPCVFEAVRLATLDVPAVAYAIVALGLPNLLAAPTPILSALDYPAPLTGWRPRSLFQVYLC